MKHLPIVRTNQKKDLFLCQAAMLQGMALRLRRFRRADVPFEPLFRRPSETRDSDLLKHFFWRIPEGLALKQATYSQSWRVEYFG